MQSQFDILTAQALKLTPDEREAFVQLLAASLDQDIAEDEALAAEVARRIADLESGATQAIPLADAFASVRAGLK
ncbi:addiction module protein [Rugamonas apoptosis]|uniref:Addiction module protein n=1 Tax=Rugamonas apoptosis TaxID=2758570 RepID=A0A7W2FAD8_9BURK|nr:addiction module protein [Rugamonas apoptosis]MBA5688061.1 addiction module protein [Rugamonas apoptosis]